MLGNKVQVISKNSKYVPFTVDINTEHLKSLAKLYSQVVKKMFVKPDFNFIVISKYLL